jgi:hypothetical protein
MCSYSFASSSSTAAINRIGVAGVKYAIRQGALILNMALWAIVIHVF